MSLPTDFDRRDLVNLALAVSGSATSAYIDRRLTVAATEHALAAKLWAHIGYNDTATKHARLAQAIDMEAVEAAAQAAVDEAEESA